MTSLGKDTFYLLGKASIKFQVSLFSYLKHFYQENFKYPAWSDKFGNTNAEKHSTTYLTSSLGPKKCLANSICCIFNWQSLLWFVFNFFVLFSWNISADACLKCLLHLALRGEFLDCLNLLHNWSKFCPFFRFYRSILWSLSVVPEYGVERYK